ncbi:MAG: hydroxymethylbilane synthase [Clostridia bacterium]|nr:hydroxymethylbilane synthase [Clostridia bacterium]
MKIVVGSRESRLAVVQSMTVVDFLRAKHSGTDVELLTMKTTGDRILDRTLDKVGGKGLFVKELDVALRQRRADVTVHSLKDMPMEVPKDLPLLCCSRREDPRDALALRAGVEMKPDLVIGTASLRRAIQLKALFPDCEIRPVRGNLQTRLRKLDEGQFDALVLAAAGLMRLGLEARISRYFSVEEIIPAAGQGILAVQGRADFDRTLLEGFADADAWCAATAERAFVRQLDGGCTSPVCAHAALDGESIHLTGLYYEVSDGSWRKGSVDGPREAAERLGIELAQALRDGREA